MQRDMFTAALITNRARPFVELPAAYRVIEGDMLRNGGYAARGLSAPTLPALCRLLVGLHINASHIQIFDRMPGGARVPCIFCDIAATAAWSDEDAKPIPVPAGIAGGQAATASCCLNLPAAEQRPALF